MLSRPPSSQSLGLASAMLSASDSLSASTSTVYQRRCTTSTLKKLTPPTYIERAGTMPGSLAPPRTSYGVMANVLASEIGPTRADANMRSETEPSLARDDHRAYCCEALEWATLFASLVTAAAVAGSVLFLARQTSQSVEQFLVANELAGARALAQGYELWDHVITRFID